MIAVAVACGGSDWRRAELTVDLRSLMSCDRLEICRSICCFIWSSATFQLSNSHTVGGEREVLTFNIQRQQ